MSESEFFTEIEHKEVPWGERSIYVPVFYYDLGMFSAQFLAPTGRVKALLPSARLHPLRVTPWHSVVAITCFEYRDCDIGPYNEVSVSVPCTLDEPSPLFTGILRAVPGITLGYVRHLPVTTEIARAAGVEFAGYPKFLAEIEFEEDGDWIRCRLEERGEHALTLAVRKGALQPAPRYRNNAVTTRNGRILRSEMIVCERDQTFSRDAAGVQLTLGEHRIGQELKGMQLGRLVGYQHTPHTPAILTPVIESWAA